jgi:hypothetical protein
MEYRYRNEETDPSPTVNSTVPVPVQLGDFRIKPANGINLIKTKM